MALRNTEEETQKIKEGTLLDVLNSNSSHVLSALDLPKGGDVLADIPAYG